MMRNDKSLEHEDGEAGGSNDADGASGLLRNLQTTELKRVTK